jgi:glucosamine 6-phosphate synthetase-like amidotransferase/phosphosugar isomerase protein
MCGIAAVFLHPQERKRSDWAAIREMFTLNLITNEERGREATGCAVFGREGQVRMLKLPMAASRFVTLPEYRSLLDAVDSTTTLILGHTRLSTKGDPAIAFNNHPLEAGPVFGIHNGQVNNADDLFASYGLPRQGEVDSEIIFRFLETISPTKLVGDNLKAIRPLIRLLDGQFTFLAWDQRRPERLLVLKHNNPLCVHYLRDWNALVFSSRYIFLRKVFGNNVFTEVLPSDQLLLFEAACLPEAGLRPAAAMKLYEGEKSSGR